MDNKDNIMIALLPITTDWSTLELPHLTLVYCGKVSDHKPTDFNVMAKDVASLAMISRPLSLMSMGVEKLGPPEDLVTAIILRPTTELMAMRNFVDQWDKSEWPSYRPHVTVGSYPLGQVVSPDPSQVAFDRIMIAWGEQQLTFWLKRA